MNRKLLSLTIVLLLLATGSVYAESPKITNDSLRFHFQREEPYLVYAYFERANTRLLNHKALYYDQELKEYLMTWFDTDVWIKYKVFSAKRGLLEKFDYDPRQKKYFITSYLREELKLDYDSICSNTALINLYFAQSLEKWEAKEREKVLKDSANLIPPWKVLNLHAEIAYPEAYKKIKDLWYKHNKTTNIGNGIFTGLLAMNDPEAQAIMDKIVEEFVSSNGEIDNHELNSAFLPIGNAYAIKKLIEILPVHKLLPGLSGTDGTSYVPYDFFTHSELRQICIFKNTSINITSAYNVEENRKNKDKIIEAAQEIIKKWEEEERYWMENIPFDYVPQVEIIENNDD